MDKIGFNLKDEVAFPPFLQSSVAKQACHVRKFGSGVLVPASQN